MPRPIYIICCETATVDSLTGMPSYINVIDSLKINIPNPVPEAPSPPFGISQHIRIRTAALWMIDEEKGDHLNDEYEHEFVLHPPGQWASQSPPGQIVTFKFDKLFYRFDALIQGSPFTESGFCRVESKLRRKGEQEWKTQNIPLLVEVTWTSQTPP